MNGSSFLKSNLILTLITLLGMILSFLSQLVIAGLFGTSMERDAYFVAMTIPGYISAVFIGAYGVVLLPAIIQIQKEGEVIRNLFISNNLNLVCILLSAIALGIGFFSKEIIGITAIGFKNKELELSSELLKILIPSIVFQGLANILTSVSQVRSQFIFPAISSLITSLFSLLFVLIFVRFWGIHSLAMGTVIGSFMALLILVPIFKDDYTFQLKFLDNNFGRVLLLSTPLFLSGIFTRSNTLFERLLASTLPSGSVSYLGYAAQVQNILCSIAVGGIGTIIFPLLSRKWAEGDLLSTRKYYEEGIRLILVITIPIAVLFIFNGEHLIQLIFERGKFYHSSTVIVSKIFALLTISFICNSLGSVVGKIFYLTGKTFWVSITDVAVSWLYFGSSFFLVQHYSFYGLSIASSISALFSVILSLILAQRILNGFNFLYIIKAPSLVMLVSIFSFFLSYFFTIPLVGKLNLYELTFVELVIYVGSLYVQLSLIKLKEVVVLNSYLMKFLFKRTSNR